MKKSYSTRAKLHLYFFKSTLEIALVCQLAGTLFLYLSTLLVDKTNTSTSPVLFFIPFGLFLDLIYKEIARKENYYFYYNQGISKVELWLVAICSWLTLLIIINLTIKLCVNVWKWIV
ncbi:hypothetical protein DXB27_04525 [Parabacteroides gordonii]|jgi:hypothetical protein|uniref:Uncharacterized protein n=1 Tax=Parabacteroides gordonii MS-1 = DSM 23371 TaxID=1203610 RepID=A0A0F5JJH1_9BACT|nr:hypothetical protein HMPREF1536_01780 [Parabacteroides gordonii MS-1 = DSM 23371]RGP17487.1 hypothetical protein DXB27_04525 [Parabacteroides gordonii]